MSVSLERILKNWTDEYISDCYFCLPAVVVGVQNLHENRIDVIPLPNRNYMDNTIQEYAVLKNVLLSTVGYDDSAVLVPVKQGNTVLLVFSQVSIDPFKGGATQPYDNFDRRFLDLNDAIAIAGITPFSKSNNNPSRYKYGHSTEDLVIVHNIGSNNQSEIRLNNNGEIVLNTTNDLTVNTDTNLNGNVTSTGSLVAEEIVSKTAASGIFTSLDGRIVTVRNGIITSIV